MFLLAVVSGQGNGFSTEGNFYHCYESLSFVLLLLLLLLFLWPTSTKPQAEILELNNVNGCNDISFGDHSILEGDRIPPLKSHGQALEEELCFPGVLSDNRDASANLLRHFYDCLLPCTCCLDGKRTEDYYYLFRSSKYKCPVQIKHNVHKTMSWNSKAG